MAELNGALNDKQPQLRGLRCKMTTVDERFSDDMREDVIGAIERRNCDYRSCIVDNAKALFHRWIEKELLILKTGYCLTNNDAALLRSYFEKTHVIPKGVTIEKARITLGIVEFEDGSVKEIEPTSIKFLDSRNLICKYGKEVEDVLYLCDRRACDKCSLECNHTPNILHAKNFIRDGRTMTELSDNKKGGDKGLASTGFY